ncbi:MFS transporter [Phytohabitans suffuscus]|uniref:MFS transporter n=2 Tax=Phytohabitans suffuscus TaxID=624315 RepID=A0A6F8Y9U9_9ACTN|nr:MFS transporter [Phytohabitans suffuscus]
MAASGGLTMGFGRLTFPVLLEEMTADYLGSYSVAGLVSAANLGGYLVGTLLSNAWLRRTPARTLVVRGLCVATACLALTPAVRDVYFVLAVMFVLGIASGAVWISCVPVVSGAAPAERRGVAYGLMLSGIGTSVALTGLVVRLADHLFGPGSWRAVWVIEGAIGLLVIASVLLLLRPAPTGHPAPAAGPGHPHGRGLPSGIGWAVAIYLFYGTVHGLYSNYVVAAAQEGGNLSSGQATAAFSVLGLTNVLGGLVLGRLSDGWGRRRLLVGALVALSGCAAAVPLHQAGLTFASCALYGMLMTGVPAVLTASLADRLPARQLASGYAAISLAVGVGQLVSPPAGGWLADVTGDFALTYLVAAALGLVAAAAAVRFPDQKRIPA